MQEKKSPHFQLGEDNAVHDELLQSELQELKMEKLSHRVTLLTILIPCMVGIILIIAYLDIKDRVNRTQDTGTIGVQKLAKDLESKFSSLSLEQAKIKDSLANIPAMESASAFMQSRLKQMQKSVKQVESSSLHRKEFSQALQDINDKFDTIPAALEDELQNIKKANQQLVDDTATLTSRFHKISESMKEIKESVKQIDAGMAAMEDQKISKSELDLALKLKEIAAKQSILEATKSLEKKIQNLEEIIRAIQKNSGSAQNNGQITDSPQSEPVKDGAANTTQESIKIVGPADPVQKKPDPSSATQSSLTQSKDIVEQNIE
jgi:chromosome segregation ATPase